MNLRSLTLSARCSGVVGMPTFDFAYFDCFPILHVSHFFHSKQRTSERSEKNWNVSMSGSCYDSRPVGMHEEI